jgi:hypothetical protein
LRIAIVGSREYKDLPKVVSYVVALPPDTIVVSGGARGVDQAAEHAAHTHGLDCIICLADWELHGKKAGYLRNIDIVNNADKLVAFWDGKSKGTQHSINLAKSKGIPVEIYQ